MFLFLTSFVGNAIKYNAQFYAFQFQWHAILYKLRLYNSRTSSDVYQTQFDGTQLKRGVLNRVCLLMIYIYEQYVHESNLSGP